MPTGQPHKRSIEMAMAVYELARDGCTKAEVINRLGISMTVFKKNYKDEWTEGLKAKAAHAMEVWRESRESRQLDEALLPSPSLSPETDSDSNLPGEEKTKVTRKMGEKSMHAAAVLQEMLARGMKLAPITGKEAGNHFRTRLGDNVITIQKLADESKVSFAVAQKIIAKYRKSIAPDREFVLDPVETGLTREEILDYQAQKARIELEMPNSQESTVVRMAYEGFTITQCARLLGYKLEKFKKIFQDDFNEGTKRRLDAAKPPRTTPSSRIPMHTEKEAEFVRRLTVLRATHAEIAYFLGITKANLRKLYKKELETANWNLRMLAYGALVESARKGGIKAIQMILQRDDPSWSNQQRLDINQRVESKIVQYDLPKKKKLSGKDLMPTSEEMAALENVVELIPKTGSD